MKIDKQISLVVWETTEVRQIHEFADWYSRMRSGDEITYPTNRSLSNWQLEYKEWLRATRKDI